MKIQRLPEKPYNFPAKPPTAQRIFCSEKRPVSGGRADGLSLKRWAVSLQERSGGPIKIAGDVGSLAGGGLVEQRLADPSACCTTS